MAACLPVASASSPEVQLSEIYINPPGYAEIEDQGREYIELAGEPGESLDGLSVIVITHEVDEMHGERVEVDEAFDLTGWVMNDSGFFLLVNTTSTGYSETALHYLQQHPDYSAFPTDESHLRPRWIGGASFFATHRSSHSPTRRLSNDSLATTVLLVRHAPRSLRKDIVVDADLDGVLDHTASLTVQGDGIDEELIGSLNTIDAVAWRTSHRGLTYAASEKTLQIIHGFQPDALSRIYHAVDPDTVGHHCVRSGDSDGGIEFIQNSVADEQWIIGEIADPLTMRYDTSFNAQGFYQVVAPTDHNSMRFSGLCSPEPSAIGFGSSPCFPDLPAGSDGYAIYDIGVFGMRLSPGAKNSLPHDLVRLGGNHVESHSNPAVQR